MNSNFEQIATCIERGKVNKNAPYPPDMKGQDGADELARAALAAAMPAAEVLEACMTGMRCAGLKFSQNKVFTPDLLMAAKAMKTVMAQLKPYFQSGAVKPKGTFVIGTVSGDLHDIGKNLVAMTVEGAGWEVVDLGIDIPIDKFIAAVKDHPGCVLGLSALLTTTMTGMEKIAKVIKTMYPSTRIIVGGAPLSKEYADKIGADAYSPDPQGAVEYLNSLKG